MASRVNVVRINGIRSEVTAMAFLSIPVTFSSQNPFFRRKFLKKKRINWHKLNFKSVKATYCLPTIEIYIVGFTHTHTDTHIHTHKHAHKHTHKHTHKHRERERERERS